ncbi:CHAT domain-containing protein [Gordonia phosphorivorans]|uniref:CHAT domain-containing protein n=1 Tax=Gordonia phosphorivorans TaxID=1056982 RepID=A0ABV6HBT5_9ACTN
MLITAHKAETAIRINHSRKARPVVDREPLRQAASAHLARASEAADPYATPNRVQNLAHAASIALFTDQMGDSRRKWFDEDDVVGHLARTKELDLGWLRQRRDAHKLEAPTAAHLLEFALGLIGHFDESGGVAGEVDYLELRVKIVLGWIRSSRIGDSPGTRWSDSLHDRIEEDLIPGTSLEYYRWNFEYERIAALCGSGSVEDIAAYLDGSDPAERPELLAISQHWWRGKVLFARALAEYLCGRSSADDLVYALTVHVPDALSAGRTDSAEYVIHQLNATLCAMDVTNRLDGPVATKVVERALDAIAAVERIMTRWRILARSGSSLALVLRACLGDVAFMCARNPAIASEAGFRLATIVKQSTLGLLLRDPAVDLPRVVRTYLTQIAEQEEILWNGNLESEFSESVRADQEAALEKIRNAQLNISRNETRVLQRLGPLSIDMTGEMQAEPDDIRDRLHGAEALDFVWLARTVNPSDESWFKTHISPTGKFTFTGPYGSFNAEQGKDQLAAEWLQGLPKALLPADLGEGDASMLLISPHQKHDQVPWPALQLGDQFLAERYTIALVPSLPNLSDEVIEAVSGPNMAYLAGDVVRNGRAVGSPLDLTAELASWEYRPGPGEQVHVLLDERGWKSRAAGSTDLAELLAEHAESTGFLHVAAHCAGSGLRQKIQLAKELTVAQAFSLKWPRSVLLATCHSGEIGEDSEPLALSVALMLGGATSVVAGIGGVDDRGAGYLSSRIVTAVREGTDQTLPELLRAAQCAAIADGLGPGEWGRLVAYVRGNGVETRRHCSAV